MQSTVLTYSILYFEKLIKASCLQLCSNTLIALQTDVPQGVIRVQAPHLSKVSMAIQLTEELKAGDIVARFLSQKRYKHILVLLSCWEKCLFIYYIEKKVLKYSESRPVHELLG